MGDPSKAENILNWKASMGFERLVRIMVEADLEKIDRTQTNR
jgi:GDP-D-mannose dehydratase